MNYLQLVNSLRQKCGVTGSDLTNVASQIGESLRLCNWINDAWMEIQEAHDNWKFLQTSFSFLTVNQRQSNTPVQAGVTDLGNWKKDSFRIYVTSIGTNSEIWLPWWEYDDFRNLYQFGSQRNVYSKPVVFSIDPSKNILIGPGPNSTSYTIVGEYFKVPSELVTNTDTPSLPTQFHRIIVYRAMMMYANYEAAPEVMNEGQTGFKKFMTRLEIDQLPQVDLGGPLC